MANQLLYHEGALSEVCLVVMSTWLIYGGLGLNVTNVLLLHSLMDASHLL